MMASTPAKVSCTHRLAGYVQQHDNTGLTQAGISIYFKLLGVLDSMLDQLPFVVTRYIFSTRTLGEMN